MDIATPDGATRVCGEAQGFLGLPIRDEAVQDSVFGLSNAMVTRWRPSEEERLRILAGEDIYLRTIGATPQPIMLGVGDPHVYGW